MDIAAEAVAALAAPAPAHPRPTVRQQMAVASIRRNGPAASHALECVANALWTLRADFCNEVDALLLTDAIVVVEDVIKRFAAPASPQASPHPVGRFAPNENGRGGE